MVIYIAAVFAFWWLSTGAKPHAIPYGVGSRATPQFHCYSGPQLPEEQVLTIHPSKPFGRLGNVFLVLVFAILDAWENSCHLELPSVLESLPGWQSKCNIIYNSDTPMFRRFKYGIESCGPRLYDDYGSNKRVSRLLTTNAIKFAYDILGLYTGTNETHAYGEVCDRPDKLALHVRGGDIVKGYFASNGTYIQQTESDPSSGVITRTPFATSYYLKVVESVLDSNPRIPVRVYFEDTYSPSYGMLHPLHILADAEIYVGRPLFEDVQDITCSHELVSSRGSFLYAVSLRYKFQRVHFQADSAKSPYRCHLPNAQGYYLMNDAAYSNIYIQDGSMPRDSAMCSIVTLPCKLRSVFAVPTIHTASCDGL